MSSHELAESAAPEENGHGSTGRSPGRRGWLIVGIALLACAGLVGHGLLGTDEQPQRGAAPGAEVTYDVTGTGTAEISYLARGEAGTATVEKSVTLPWSASVRMPLGKTPAVTIVLDEKGGQASCTLTVRNKHVQRATATGAFGRAACTGGAQPRQD
ncbi:hypothetical protein [Streptomyces sp. NPDC056944]|uniref:hypothetical protein n=1 Tax=unclassified Streptomyces TaxID=2593676 RepID=UPI00362F2B5F